MRILMIEDDSSMVELVKLAVASGGHVVHSTAEGEDGVDMAKIYDFDVILLDLGLPDMDGMDVIRALRKAKVEIPVIVLSGSNGVEDRTGSLDAGADDFIAKPFHPGELSARIKAVVRRARGNSQSVITVRNLSINLTDQVASVDGVAVPLTGKEYQILELLALRKGATMSKEMFLDRMYGGMDEPEIKIVDVFVCKLRKKLAKAGAHPDCVETVWGRGYVMRDPAPQPASVAA
jgi:Response regulators consisting of a CheY-like receiver domain and a winged-helix DNA-binding domain